MSILRIELEVGDAYDESNNPSLLALDIISEYNDMVLSNVALGDRVTLLKSEWITGNYTPNLGDSFKWTLNRVDWAGPATVISVDEVGFEGIFGENSESPGSRGRWNYDQSYRYRKVH